jgi:CubicO group peptidase (beta-lactamase class C family)
MSVALDFEENYTDEHSEYVQYRIATGWNPIDQTTPGPGLESFLYSLKQNQEDHGNTFLYRSPNTDLLGLLLERAAAVPLPKLLSHYLWKPMGAETEAYITLDRFGTSRAAGGICVTVRDLARIGQLFLENGQVNGRQVIPSTWIEDTCNNGDQAAWDRGNYKHKLPNGKYRNQWYQVGDRDSSISARGIHGQLLYINPSRSVVIAKLACQPEPLNDAITASFMSAFDQIAKQLG